MKFLREKVETFFEFWSRIAVSHPVWVLVVVLGLTAALLPQLRYSTMDFSTEAYLRKNDKAVTDYDAFRFQFGQSGVGLVTIETPSDVFTLENLARIKALQEDIQKSVPHIDKITSLVSVKHTEGKQDSLVVRDLVELWPKTEAEMPAFKKLVLSNPSYVGNMVSANGRITSLVIKVNNYTDTTNTNHTATDVDAAISGFEDTSAPVKADVNTHDRSHFLKASEETDFARTLMDVARKHEVDGFKIHLSGIPVANYQMATDLGESMQRDTGLGMLVLTLLLVMLFQRVSGVLMPLMVVFLTLLSTLALMPLFNIPFMGSAQILPIFLLAVGIADSMHILSIFYAKYDEGAEKKEAIMFAMTSSAVAVLMTSLTTAAGLLSFVLSDLKPTQMLGIFGSGGTMLALAYTMALVPALLAVLPIKRRAVAAQNSTGLGNWVLKNVDRMVYSFSSLGMKHAKKVFVVTMLLSVWALIGVSKIYFSHDPVRWYPKDHPTRVAGELIDRELSGSMAMEVVLDSGQDNGLYDPKFMHLIETIENTAVNLQMGKQDIKQAVSILSVIKENHKVLNEGKQEFYRIPDTREEIAQELLLFENSGSDDLEEFTDSNFRYARITLIMPFQNIIGMQQFIDTLQKKFEGHIADSGLQGVTVHLTGLIMIFAKTLLVMLWSTIENYLQSFIMVGALMFLMMGTFRTGMLAFGPNIFPVLLTVGMMGWINMPMDILTSLIGCIVIGIAVDDTIHFMHHYRKFIEEVNDPVIAVRKTLDIAGRAIVFTSVVLVGCFLVHTTDTFVTSRNFGILLSVALTTALLTNLIIVPALMKLFWNHASK